MSEDKGRDDQRMTGQGDNIGLGGLEELDEQATGAIRRALHEGRWFFSIVDVVGLLTDAPKPRNYWAMMKLRIQDEGFREVLTKCEQLKMEASDGKQRLTDAADTETLFRIIQSIPSPKAEPFKQWLAKVGRERLDEIEHPELAADRMRQHYRALGYSDDWIDRHLQGIVIRDELTNEWRERGAREGREFATLTDTLQRGTFDLSTNEHRQVKHIGQRQNLRDSMTTMELLLTALSEETAKELHQARDSQGYGELHRDAGEAGEVGGAARRDIEARTGRPVVSGENFKVLRQGRKRELQDSLFASAEEEADDMPPLLPSDPASE